MEHEHDPTLEAQNYAHTLQKELQIKEQRSCPAMKAVFAPTTTGLSKARYHGRKVQGGSFSQKAGFFASQSFPGTRNSDLEADGAPPFLIFFADSTKKLCFRWSDTHNGCVHGANFRLSPYAVCAVDIHL